MSTPLPPDCPATADRGEAAGARPGAILITVLLITAAALDLGRCGIVLVTARHGPPTAALVTTRLGAAALSLAAARGACRRRRWAGWAALLIGAASAPQAAATGFRDLYAVPDTATATVGILVMVAVLATAGPAQPSGQVAVNPCRWARGPSHTAGRTPDRARHPSAYHRTGASGAGRHTAACVASRTPCTVAPTLKDLPGSGSPCFNEAVALASMCRDRLGSSTARGRRWPERPAATAESDRKDTGLLSYAAATPLGAGHVEAVPARQSHRHEVGTAEGVSAFRAPTQDDQSNKSLPGQYEIPADAGWVHH